MSRSRKPSAPQAPAIDPQAIIRQDAQMNRMDTFGPFGSQRYTTGPDGRQEFRTELNPQMQQLMDRAAGLSMRDSSPLRQIPGFEQLVNSMMGQQLSRFSGGSMGGMGGGGGMGRGGGMPERMGFGPRQMEEGARRVPGGMGAMFGPMRRNNSLAKGGYNGG
jgi:hypothetical protein